MSIGDALLRANPRYELVLLDRLGQDERSLVEEQAGDGPPPYGLLRPARPDALEPRVVSTDTALLFLTLQEPGPCPAYVRRGLGGRLDSTLGRLVVEGILEVAGQDGFRSGLGAWLPMAPAGDGASNRNASLSVEALRYGAALLTFADLPPELLAARLYMYGRAPATTALRRRLPSNAAVADWLGLRSAGLGSTLRSAWREARPAEGSPWRSWSPRRSLPHRPHPVSFKLYISPTLETTARALAAAASGLADAEGCLGFKIGRSVEGLLRPDKMVAYFETLDALNEGAAAVQEAAAGCQPQGVPFTAAVTGDGLLSWAIDPPRRLRDGGPGRMSWRSWVTGRLADHLLSSRLAARQLPPADPAPGDPAPVDPPAWQAALARLALDGVDPATWVPDPALFDYAAAG
ncbi:MAG TPA: hypothetical protein VF763_03445 [Candidatus Limnocylindrales bacterium]